MKGALGFISSLISAAHHLDDAIVDLRAAAAELPRSELARKTAVAITQGETAQLWVRDALGDAVVLKDKAEEGPQS